MSSDVDQQLLHPVYLDVPMMVSFLAALTGGVSFEGETTRRATVSSDRELDGNARIRIPPLVSLLGFDASGRMGRKDHGEEGEEVKAVRQHTAASLFNALYETLRERGILRCIEDMETTRGVGPGDIVEIKGEFVGNPLESMLEIVGQILPYMDFAESNPALKEAIEGPAINIEATAIELTNLEGEAKALEAEVSEAKRSGNPARKAQATEIEERAKEKAEQVEQAKGLVPILTQIAQGQEQQRGVQMMVRMRDDLAAASVHDTVIEGPDGLKAILTMSSEFYSDATNAYLREGVFTAIGKVTRVLDEGDSINLLRRTVLGATGPEQGRQIIQSAVDSGELELATFDPIIESPALQILPLAVYI